MYVVSTKRTHPAHRGVILLVVLLLLTIFATLGLTLVLMTESYANSSRIGREAENLTRPDFEPELAFALFMGQFLYDVDDNTGPNSALRGHSLARTMYSWDSSLNTLCDKPYNGVGRQRSTTTPFPGLNEFDAVNYQQFGPNGSWVHDPERASAGAGGWRMAGAKNNSQYLPGAGFNAGYTYPDENNMFLAYVKQTSASNTVIIPSFHRPWLMKQADWTTNPYGKYKTLRPRKVDMDNNMFPNDAEVDNTIPPNNTNPIYDVKNLDGFPGGADSVWIDIGAPIMTTPDGVKYKMLYAALILELDSRINLNVHGNVAADSKDANGNPILDTFGNPLKVNASNQGWGPWEVNIAKILSTTENVSIFYGSQNQTSNMPHVPGRYSNPSDRNPKGPALVGPKVPRAWSALDFDAKIDAGTNTTKNTVSTSQVQPPERGGAYWHTALPVYDMANTYRNGVPLETANHPALYNPLQPSPGNQNIPLLSLVELLRYNGTNFEFLQSDLMRLAPNTLYPPTQFKQRQMVTLLSTDLARPGAMPYIWDPTQSPYTLKFSNTSSPPNPAAKDYTDTPSGSSTAFPTLQQLMKGPPTGSEFLASVARSLKVDLNRTLTSYYDNTGKFLQANYAQATRDRQNFAKDIFNALRVATGTRDPNSTTITLSSTNGELAAAQYLAQLAVNIVDYIDQDDFSTPFEWLKNTNYNPAQQWVFGTELPRLVVNEVYAQIDSGPTGSGNDVQNVWVELFNPMLSETIDTSLALNPKDVSAPLVVNGKAVYRLLVTQQQASAANQATILDYLRNPTNQDGPDSTSQGSVGTNFSTWFSVVKGADFLAQTVDPLANPTDFNDPNMKNTGFLVLGSNFKYPAATKNSPSQDPGILTYGNQKGTTANLSATFPTGQATPQPVTLILQRLACPQMPPQANSATANYNPYITVDFLAEIPAFDARQANPNPAAGQNQNQNQVPAVASRQSYGKRQPFSSRVKFTGANVIDVGAPPKYTPASPIDSQVALQSPQKPVAGQIQHSFYAHNSREASTGQPSQNTPNQTLGRLIKPSSQGPPTVQFDWLVHLDRQVISPMELMHVSAFKPAMLTQQFVTSSNGTSQANQQVAPWLDETSRLFRFFEFVETGPLTNGVVHSGRIPGKVNINMVFDQQILEALCDAQKCNYFNQAQVDAIFTALLTSRNNNSTATGPSYTADPTHGSNGDRPFWSFGVGPATGGDNLTLNNTPRGIESTLLRSIPTSGSGWGINPSAANQRLLDPFGTIIANAPTGAMEAGNTVTITTTAPHGLVPGQIVTISGVGVGGYNGTFQINSVNTSTTFAYTSQQMNLAPSGGGRAVPTSGTTENPRIRYELLNKLFNNITTRSNTFAVWVTVGFFEIARDPATGLYTCDLPNPPNPPKLAAEVGKAEGRAIRHRMFSIVDRTNLQVFNSTAAAAITIPPAVAPAPPKTYVTATVQLGQINSSMASPPKLQANMTLVYDPATSNEETVVLSPGTVPGTFTAKFYKSHALGCTVICRGNPGPQPTYNPRNDPYVVRYFAVIE